MKNPDDVIKKYLPITSTMHLSIIEKVKEPSEHALSCSEKHENEKSEMRSRAGL